MYLYIMHKDDEHLVRLILVDGITIAVEHGSCIDTVDILVISRYRPAGTSTRRYLQTQR